MSRVVDEVLDHLRADARVDASRLAIRIDALARFRRATEPYLPADWLEPAEVVAARAGGRLSLSRTHTVVAIAGPTGSGKSSLFNALAGMEISPAGIRRPTTGVAHACVWGPPAEAAPVLDWLGVSPAHRFTRESALDAEDQAGLRGLILLDLPDFDSLQRDHATEVQRLLELVDLVLWVVDPQKYADHALHELQLRPLRRHRDVMVVALNQTDLLTPVQTGQVLADLRRLLAADGLADLPTVATSAVTAPGGLTGLRELLERTVAGKRAALQRLAADLDGVAAGLADLVGQPADGDIAPDRPLVDGLAAAAGFPAVTAAAGWAYRRRAHAATGWPVPRSAPPSPSLAPPHPPTQRAAVSLAARAFASRAADRLPPPWPAAIADASRSRLDEVPAALSMAVASTVAAHNARTPWWWRMIGAGQWLAVMVAALGLCWLLIGWLLRAIGLPVVDPRIGAVLLVGGLVGGALLALVSRPLVWWAGRRAQAQVAATLREALTEVGRVYVVAPVRSVRSAYADARAALQAVAGG